MKAQEMWGIKYITAKVLDKDYEHCKLNKCLAQPVLKLLNLEWQRNEVGKLLNDLTVLNLNELYLLSLGSLMLLSR